MQKILLVGFENRSIVDELNEHGVDLNLILSDTYSHALEVLHHHVQTAIIHEDFFMSHENEFKKYIRSRNDTKFFIIVNPYDPKYVEQFHDEKYSIYALKTPSVTIDFIKNIISFSEELDSVYQYKELIIDYREKTVMVNNKTLVLTPMEFDLLVYLKIHASTTLSREDLIRAVWGYSFLGDSRTIDTHIKSLRRKLGPYRCIVKTVWGKGYKYSEC